jgi:hypothetical protein
MMVSERARRQHQGQQASSDEWSATALRPGNNCCAAALLAAGSLRGALNSRTSVAQCANPGCRCSVDHGLELDRAFCHGLRAARMAGRNLPRAERVRERAGEIAAR